MLIVLLLKELNSSFNNADDGKVDFIIDLAINENKESVNQ